MQQAIILMCKALGQLLIEANKYVDDPTSRLIVALSDYVVAKEE